MRNSSSADDNGTSDEAELMTVAAAPVAGNSKLARLPNGDTLTISIDQGLVRTAGIDSIVGEPQDAAGQRPVTMTSTPSALR